MIPSKISEKETEVFYYHISKVYGKKETGCNILMGDFTAKLENGKMENSARKCGIGNRVKRVKE